MAADQTPEGRRARFEQLAPELVEPLRRFLVRRTDAATADDVLSETLLVCWRRLDDVPTGAALPWAYAVARRCLANAERGARRRERLAAKVAATSPPAAASSSRGTRDDAVTDALAALRPQDAELLRLWAWEQLTPAEIAAVLDVTPNAASIRLHRARRRLEDALRKIEGTPGHEESQEGRDR